MQNKELMWAYLAGCVDCDGWISKVRTESINWTVVVGITQHVKCRAGMDRIVEFLRCEGVSATYTDRDSNTHHHTPMLNITTKANKSSLKFLNGIEKYMLFKGDLARECIEHLVSKAERYRFSGEETPKPGLKRRHWKDTEIQEAFALKGSGYNNIAIAEKLGRSPQSVAQKFQRSMGLQKPLDPVL